MKAPRCVKTKELRAIAIVAMEHGWTIEMTNGGHVKFVTPAGKPLFTASTPSDQRGIKNFRSCLRREGLPV